jgi:hypothetical protein
MDVMTKTTKRTRKTKPAIDPAEIHIERDLAQWGTFDGPATSQQEVILCKRSDWPAILSINPHLRRWYIMTFERHVVVIEKEGPVPMSPERRAALWAHLDAIDL